MATWDPSTAAAVAGLAVISICTLYKENAPTLAELRDAHPGDDTHQQLSDADYTVGSLGVIAGLGMAWLTKDITALILITFALGTYILWFHAVLNRTPNPSKESA